MKQNIFSFLEASKSGKAVDTNGLANAHLKVEQELSEQKIKLISHLAAVKGSDGKIVAGFDSDVESVLKPLSAAEEKAARVKKDVDRYLELIGDAPSVTALSEETSRLKIKIRNSEASARGSNERCIRTGKDPATDAATIDLEAKADRIRTECQPMVESLMKRISEARQILDSYHDTTN